MKKIILLSCFVILSIFTFGQIEKTFSQVKILDSLKLEKGASDGKVLMSDPYGSATWEDATGKWLDATTGDNIYYTDSVGIGTSSPNYPLEVVGDIGLSGNVLADGYFNTGSDTAILVNGIPVLSINSSSIFLGEYIPTLARSSVFIGTLAGYLNTSDLRNTVLIGDQAGRYLTKGLNNVIITNGGTNDIAADTASNTVLIGSYVPVDTINNATIINGAVGVADIIEDTLIISTDHGSGAPSIRGGDTGFEINRDLTVDGDLTADNVTDISTEDLTFGGDITIEGELTSDNSFGEMSDPADVISTATANYYTLTNWTAGEYNEATLDTDSTILVSQSGTYLINFSFSFTHSANSTTIHICAFNSTDNVEFTNIETEAFVRTGTDTFLVSGTGLAVLAASDKISIRGKADNTGNLTVKHGNLNIIRIK